MSSILAKAQSYMGSGDGKQLTNSLICKVMLGLHAMKGTSPNLPEEAAKKFIEVLQNEINSCGLSAGAIDAISNLEHTATQRTGENTYVIGVYFAGNLSRPSLDEAKYGGINNLAALFNNGVDHTMHPIQGEWHGSEIWSRTTIPGTHFVDSAIRNFMSSYASKYNVTDISVSEAFQ
jgi:hypothetical protein